MSITALNLVKLPTLIFYPLLFLPPLLPLSLTTLTHHDSYAQTVNVKDTLLNTAFHLAVKWLVAYWIKLMPLKQLIKPLKPLKPSNKQHMIDLPTHQSLLTLHMLPLILPPQLLLKPFMSMACLISLTKLGTITFPNWHSLQKSLLSQLILNFNNMCPSHYLSLFLLILLRALFFSLPLSPPHSSHLSLIVAPLAISLPFYLTSFPFRLLPHTLLKDLVLTASMQSALVTSTFTSTLVHSLSEMPSMSLIPKSTFSLCFFLVISILMLIFTLNKNTVLFPTIGSFKVAT